MSRSPCSILREKIPAYAAGQSRWHRTSPLMFRRQRQSALNSGESSLGLIVESPSGKRFAYMPAVPKLTAALLKEFEAADVLFFDGTFWSDDELIRIQGSGQTAQQMGHVPLSSAAGSLAQLAQLKRPRKIHLHINNTNPMLNEAGPEYRQVRTQAGKSRRMDGSSTYRRGPPDATPSFL